MRKAVLAVLAISCLSGTGLASSYPSMSTACVESHVAASVSIPTGVFFNGSDFVKVENGWVRICINRQSEELDINNVELDPYGNYALVLENGASITIYSNGRSLYYGGTVYTKR